MTDNILKHCGVLSWNANRRRGFMKGWGLWILGLLCIGQGCAFNAQGEDMVYEVKKDKSNKEIMESVKALDTATFGGGCFWCTEAIFQSIEGVEQVVSGYSGGRSENPSYEAVCSGMTGHAEVIQIVFDPSVIRYEKLLEVRGLVTKLQKTQRAAEQTLDK